MRRLSFFLISCMMLMLGSSTASAAVNLQVPESQSQTLINESDAISAKSKYIGTWELSINDGNGDIKFLLVVSQSGNDLKASITDTSGKDAGITIKSCKETASGALSIYMDAAGYDDLDMFLSLDSKDSNKISGSVMSAAPVSGIRKK